MLPVSCCLVPSPIWYSSCSLDTFEWNYEGKYGIFFYATRNHIYFFKLTECFDSNIVEFEKKSIYEAQLIHYVKAHENYITGVCAIVNGCTLLFKEQRFLSKIVSCGKDKLIKIWGFDDETGCCCLKYFNLDSTKIREDFTCVTVNFTNTVICGFKKGFLLTWNYGTESEFGTFSFETDDVQQVLSRMEKFAVSYRKGLVAVYVLNSYNSISKYARFRAHNSDVCSMCWNPFPTNEGSDFLTSGKDRKIKLWNLSKNSTTKVIIVPNSIKKLSKDAGESKEDNTTGTSSWISVCWSQANDGCIILSTAFGCLGVMFNPDFDIKFFTYKQPVKSHTRSVFAIKEFSNNTSVLISHSMDRIVNISRFFEKADKYDWEIVLSIPCLGGSVLALDGNDLNNQLAIGCGEQMIRFWRFDSNIAINRKSHDVTNVWRGVNGEVSALAWHPHREGILAFASSDGQVGLVNLLRDKKTVIESSKHHSSRVYGLSWGVDIQKGSSDLSLELLQDSMLVYSVGNYALHMHDFRKEVYKDVSNWVSDGASRISEFSMHPSLRYFVVGYGNGIVNLFRTGMGNPIASIRNHSKGISRIRWCPVRLGGSTDFHLFKLAIGSNERFVTVTDLSRLVNEFENSMRENVEAVWSTVDVAETLAMLKGHGDRITDISWCPNDADRLLSVSYDHSAFVWSVSSNEPLATFNRHQGKLFCCKWSDRDTDAVYTGGDDGNLFCWKPSAQTVVNKFNRRRQKDILPPGVLTTTIQSSVEPEKNRNTETEKCEESTLKENRTVSYVKKRNSLFPTTLFFTQHSIQTFQSAILDYSKGRDSLACFELFGNRSALLKQIDIELQHLGGSNGTLDNYFVLLLWTGRLGRAITEAVSKNYVPDWLLTLLFGSISINTPYELVRAAVGNTLVTRKDPVLAATQWLVVGRTDTAIDLLITNGLLREAVVLCKLRRPPSDPLQIELLDKLQATYFKNGAFELSAVCCLATDNVKGFVEAINRREGPLARWVMVEVLLEHDTNLAHTHAMTFIGWLLQEALTNPEFDGSPWVARFSSRLEVAQYTVLWEVHRAIFWDTNGYSCLTRVHRIVTDAFIQYGQQRMSALQAQVAARMTAEQINESASAQIGLYLTYELVHLFSCSIEAGDSCAAIGQDQLRAVTRLVCLLGKEMISQLTRPEETGDSHEVVQLLRQNLKCI